MNLYLPLLAVALLAASGCTKVEKEFVSVTISNTDTLEYSLGFFGDEEGATIEKQPKHARLSDMTTDPNLGEYIYLYLADSSYTGSDYVELRSARGSDGESPNRDVIVTKLTITVQDR